MASSEKLSSVTARQFVVGASVPLAFADLAVAGDYFVTDLPSSAVVTGGWIFVDDAFDGGATMTVTVEDSAGALLQTLSGALDTSAVAKLDITVLGSALSKAGAVKITTSADLTQGAGFLYLEYIVQDRSQFSEG